MITNKLKDLVKMSQAIGNNSAYIQGGGGNTSVKHGDFMAIKASGSLLSQVSLEKAFSVVSYKEIQDCLRKPRISERALADKINSFSTEDNNRPSIETGFHALLGNSVMHCHSVYANILNCSKEGKSIALNIFPEAFWIEYGTPGRDLTLKIMDAVQCDKGYSKIRPGIFFLQNHGLIISASNPNDAIRTHQEVNNKIISHLNIPKADFKVEKAEFNENLLNENILFPDQVIYLMGDEKIKFTKGAFENIFACNYIYDNILKLGLNPNYLDKSEAHKLLNMESEKYRHGVITR